jgi:hypothetical protein
VSFATADAEAQWALDVAQQVQQKAMTCGYAVNEAVDNPAYAWITTVILWITKIISIAPLGRLRRAGLKE